MQWVHSAKESSTEQTITDHMSEESEQRRTHQYSMFGDNWSVLRFVKGNKSKTLEISPSGKCYCLN